MFAVKTFEMIPASMKKTVEVFVPKGLHQFINFGEDEIKVDPHVIQMMLYRSQEDFIEMLFHFRSIPGGFAYFCSDLAEQAQTLPPIFQSLRRNEYCFNQSIVELFHKTLPTDFFPPQETHFIQCIIGFYQQCKMGKLFQLVPFHQELIAKIKADLLELRIPKAKAFVKKETAFELLREILPVSDKDPEYSSIWEALEKYEKKSSLRRKPYFEMIFLIEKAIEKFDKLIENYPKPGHPLVRLFEDNKNKFVLAHELLESMEKADMDVTGIKERIERMQKLQTIAFNDLGLNGDQLKQIEFVLTPIDGSEFRALYIPSFNGNYCITSSDFLMETIKETITVKGIFQLVDEKNSHVVFQLIKDFEGMVSEASKGCHFIDVVVAEMVKTTLFESLNNLFGDKTFKTVRKVGPKGFTLKDFQNEVRYLGIHKIFPDNLNWCTEAYNDRIEKKSAKDLKMCDMYEALECLQIAAIVDTIPSIMKFCHIHKVCRDIFSHCHYCKGTLPLNENVVVASESEEKQEEVIEKEPTPPSSEDVSATSSSSESTSEDVEKKIKRKEKKVRQAEKKKLAKEGSQLGAERVAAITLETESKVCEKCFRTSQKCMEANEKFRQEKIKNKALKKELKTVSAELEASKQREMEKDEEIRILKEKLAASEEVVAEFQNREEFVAQIEDTPVVTAVPEVSESRPDMMEVLIKLLDIKDTLPEHKKEATELAEELLSKTTQKKYHELVETEMVKFRSDYSVYYQLVEEHVNWIRKNPKESMDLLRLLPNYPELSKEFHKAYDNVVNKKELDDQECLICMESMEEETGTVKCNSCRRRYHMSCAWDWSIVKNECAVCKKEIEFPLEE